MLSLESRLASLSEETLNSICCPLTEYPFKNAHIVNCKGNHSFDFEVLLARFKEMKEGVCSNPGSCPICEDRVTWYRPNPALQLAVNSVLGLTGLGDDRAKSIYEAVRSLRIKADKEKIYPLQRATFSMKEGLTSEAYLSSTFQFLKEPESSSTICELSFVAVNKMRKIYFIINNSEARSKFKDYLIRNGINSKHFEIQGHYHSLNYLSWDRDEFIRLIYLIKRHNDFDSLAERGLNDFLNLHKGSFPEKT